MSRQHRKLRLATVMTASFMLLTTAGFAAPSEDATSQFDLDQVVVTATKTEKSIKDVPAAVTVITAEDLKKSHITTLDDALLHVPGVYIKGQRGMKATKISIRGLSQNRVLVLQDGMPLNNGYTGGVQWASIPIENIKKIEIIRGPFSALYGSSAMGGVINIITNQAAKAETVINAGAGGYNSHSQSFSHNAGSGKLEYFIDFSKKDSDGYVLNPAQPSDGKFGYDSEQYNVKMIYHINDTDKLTVSKGRSDYTYHYSNKTDQAERVTETLTLGYQAKLTEDKELKLRWSELNFSKYWTITGTNYSPNPAKTREGEINLNWNINPYNTIILGLNSKQDTCTGQTYKLTNPSIVTTTTLLEQSGGKTKTDSIYFQNEIKLDPKATLILGGRYDRWEFTNGYNATGLITDKSENNFSPKASLLYKTSDATSWYVSAGKSFTSPTIFNLARRWETTSTLLLPNPELKPEKSTSYEIGVTHQGGPATTTKLALFKNNVTNMIYQSFNRWLTSSKQELQWKNAGEAEITGFELELNHRFTPEISGYINYTHNNPKITANSDATLVGKQIPTVPKDSFNLGVTYSLEKLSANIDGRYISRTYESDKNTEANRGYGAFQPHFVIDTRFDYKFTANTSLAVSVNNLFDRQYYQESLAPGRNIFVELSQKF